MADDEKTFKLYLSIRLLSIGDCFHKSTIVEIIFKY